jgi:hypothetical protein
MGGVTEGAERREPWIGPVGWAIGLLLAGAFVAYLLVDQLFTDRLTVHNRTTVPVSFLTDAFGGYEEHIGACSSVEFAWRHDGSRSGWRAVGVGEHHAGAVAIELPVERRFAAGLADRFAVLVTDEGVSEVDPDASPPPCDGAPPE